MRRIVARVVLAVALLVPGAVIGAPSALAQDASGNSAVTLSGTGEFANLKVTVGQTKNLINQTVRVTWAGGTPTGATFNGNFLQIMQCWGDDAAGPDPMQCEFGAFAPGTSLSPIVSSRRQIAPVDPRLSIDSQNPNDVYLPFWPVGSAKPTQYASSNDNSYFDSQLSNEEESARTRPDGTGEIDFEMQTVRESGGLGCGAPVGDATRACWLVVVPQGATLRPTLSLDTWKQRIQFPLSFLRVGQPCPIGAPERLLAGHEVAVDAVTSWQPALCANGGALYSYTQLTDNLARSQLGQSSDPGLAILTNPVPPDQQPADRPLVYAPVVASGLAVAFNIVSNPNSPSYPAAGLPFASMKLTPRLVAKLLTQSYRNSLAGLGGALSEDDAKLISVPAHSARLQSNPVSLTADPEFLKLNPDFGLGFAAPVDVLVQLNPSDLTGQLWNWVLSDPDARAFVNGTADPSGMVVNDLEKNLTLPLDTFPRNDDSCIIQRIGTAIVKPFCASDAHLYAGDTHAAARSASRGDPLALDNINANADQIPFAYPKKQRQPVDARSLIAITDTATAARYQLSTATLLNSAGKFVAPDSAGLQAGLDAMKPDVTVSSVLQPDLASKNPAAYPLTTVSYAAASPATMVGPDGKKESYRPRGIPAVCSRAGSDPGPAARSTACRVLALAAKPAHPGSRRSHQHRDQCRQARGWDPHADPSSNPNAGGHQQHACLNGWRLHDRWLHQQRRRDRWPDDRCLPEPGRCSRCRSHQRHFGRQCSKPNNSHRQRLDQRRPRAQHPRVRLRPPPPAAAPPLRQLEPRQPSAPPRR